MNVQLGLKENWRQFSLLVLVNAFVGGMIGLERTILPQLAETDFGLEAHSSMLTFIVVFGISKALVNYYAGSLANRVGRKNLLVLGWLIGIPVPFLLMGADSWNWVLAANVLLGVNQGLAWSSTVVMKIDLIGEKNRGLAMGLNEASGYLAVAFSAFTTGWLASRYGLRPYPFYLGIAFSVAGLLISWAWVKDTRRYSALEGATSTQPKRDHIFWATTWQDKNLGSVTQAGLVNNLNDGMVWGLFPVLLATKGFTLAEIGMVVAVYPAFWGVGQLVTGKLADHLCQKNMLFWGMLLQGLALIGMLWAATYGSFLVLSALLGIGTAIVYPTFLTAIARHTHPAGRKHWCFPVMARPGLRHWCLTDGFYCRLAGPECLRSGHRPADHALFGRYPVPNALCGGTPATDPYSGSCRVIGPLNRRSSTWPTNVRSAFIRCICRLVVWCVNTP